MANNNLLWHWSGTHDSALPLWVDNSMYTGAFTHPYIKTGCATGRNGLTRCGKVTNGFMKALVRAKQILNGTDIDGFGCNSKTAIAEMTITAIWDDTSSTVGVGETVCVAYDKANGTFRASKGGAAYDVAKGTSAPFFLALIADMYYNDPEFTVDLDNFVTTTVDDDKRAYACYLADKVYVATSGNTPKYVIPDASSVNTLSATRMSTPTMRPDSYAGNFQKFPITNVTKKKTGSKGKSSSVMPTADFVDSFIFSNEKLDEQQEKLVPVIDDKFIVGQTLINICKHIKESTKRPRPIRNILLRGEPGAGKTEMYVGIAAGCHLPLYRFAANATTEPYDLFGQFVPVDEDGNEGDKVPVNQILADLPSAEDISVDPVFAYQEITGEYKADATPTECMAAMFRKAQNSLDKGNGQKFKFVPGQLVYAMKFGGVWGFDEVSLPQNPGVVPSLNPAMDGTQSITLPNGEIVKRHPNCIFVGTTNLDLEGCRNLNQAWTDRCQLIIDLAEPNDEELLARIKAMTGFDDATDGKIVDLNRFIQSYHAVKELTKTHRMDDGSIGPRHLADWVLSTLITGDAVQSAGMTIISGATADPRSIAELEEKIADIF